MRVRAPLTRSSSWLIRVVDHFHAMRTWPALILLGFWGCSGCTTAPTALDPLTQSQIDKETEQALEVRIVSAVKRWYGAQDVRVVIENRSPGRWKLRVGPEIRETTVEVDTGTCEIVRVWPGY